MEAVIVSGLKRPANGKLVAGAGAGRQEHKGGAALQLAIMCVAAVGRARWWLRRLTTWAAGRSLAPNSLTGISLLLALCAAAWLSGGTEQDTTRGAIALCGWLLTQVGARRLAMFMASQGSVTPKPVMRIAKAPDGGTDWLVLPGLAWDDDDQADDGPGDEAATGMVAGDVGARSFGWLSAVCMIAAESAVYGGIAAAGQSAALTGIWPLAVMAIVSVAVAEMLGTCRGATADAQRGRSAWSQALWHLTGKALAPPAGFRVLLAMLGLAVTGPRLALFLVLAVEALSICCTIAMLGKIGPAAQGVLLACRDDGAMARWAGRLVQGNLIPLPPALAGVIATTLLAALGLRNLPGIIALTPPVVMMLASPGSSHPHDGRFDWLVPVLLALGQYIYLAALGFAFAVPGPVIYSACALTAIWYANVAADARGSATIMRPSSGIGWEARMFMAGLAAIFGIATFGYLGLAAYLGVLICRKVVIGYLIPREEDRR